MILCFIKVISENLYKAHLNSAKVGAASDVDDLSDLKTINQTAHWDEKAPFEHDSATRVQSSWFDKHQIIPISNGTLSQNFHAKQQYGTFWRKIVDC